MDNVIEIERRTPPKNEQRAAEDDWLLEMCAGWRVARAEQQKNWADYELATMYGRVSGDHFQLEIDPLHRMQEYESILARMEPRTMLCAREMLRIAVTILAHAGEDPDGTLAEGPVLDLVRNVLKALEHCKGELRVGQAK